MGREDEPGSPVFSSPPLRLRLSEDSAADASRSSSDDVEVLPRPVDPDMVAPNSKSNLRWSDLARLKTPCGPVLTDLRTTFPDVTWDVRPMAVRLVGTMGQQIQIISRKEPDICTPSLLPPGTISK